MDYPECFSCPQCRNTRIPDSRTVNKSGKRWTIVTCRICKYNDIGPAAAPRKVFKGGHFVDEDDSEPTDNNS